MEIEEPATDLVTVEADGNLMKKAAVLVLRAVLGEHALQGLSVEVLMLHAAVSFSDRDAFRK
jgi:hypothetical protein